MGFHHTLFVRQSIENVDELKKYMYLTIDAGDQRQPTEQGTYGSAGTPLERCALICDEVARPPPSQEQEGTNTPQSQSPTTRSTSAHPPLPLQGTYGADRLRGQAVSLFWAIYIAIHGYEEYAQIGRGYSNVEINEKQKIVATIQNSPTIL